MRYIDIRSDTVTQPTQKMRDAMYTAVVGDDVNRDDPTMLELEELAAKLVGKEAAMFVPSGTMGNQVSIMTHTRRGDEVICGELSHIVIHEVGAPAVLSGVMVRTIKTADYLRPEQLCLRSVPMISTCPIPVWWRWKTPLQWVGLFRWILCVRIMSWLISMVCRCIWMAHGSSMPPLPWAVM